ncbi:MAG: hypothetical protein ACJAVK_001031 [Akkermansiaceae bacterium]
MEVKQALGLIIGIIVGVAGGIMFTKSQRPEPDSLEDRLELAEQQAERAERQLRALRKYAERSERGEFRRLVRDLKDGKEVSFDDLLGTAKPWMRQISPVMERVRKVNEANWAESRVSEWTREYDLNDAEKEELKAYFLGQSEANAEKITGVIESDESGFVEFVQATNNDWRDFEGASDLMEGFLEGEELAAFQNERLDKRVDAVQDEADRKLGRLDGVVGLDDGQQEELFRVMVRGSEDYRPEVNPEDYAGDASQLDQAARDAAIDSVLRPEQRATLNEYRAEQAREIEEQWRKYQLAPPKNFDLLEGDIF